MQSNCVLHTYCTLIDAQSGDQGSIVAGCGFGVFVHRDSLAAGLSRLGRFSCRVVVAFIMHFIVSL